MTFSTISKPRLWGLLVFLCIIVPITTAFAGVAFGTLVWIVLLGVSFGSLYLWAVFRNPFLGVISLLFLGFFSTFFARELVEIPLIALDLVIFLAIGAALFHYKDKKFFAFTNDLTILMTLWFVWSFLQVVNPEASIAGWIRELRLSALLPLLLIVLGFLAFNRVKHLDLFLIVVIGCSTLAALNGIKQNHIGLFPGEEQFLNEGGYVTHLLFGQLRVFSFYTDAGQFGASQAVIGLMALILSFAPMVKWKRILLIIASALMLYGMLISGTRGALFALFSGAVVALGLWRDTRYIVIGLIALMGLFCFLKFTYIGNGNYAIYRLRSALNPEDASLNVRFETQEKLYEYLKERPFGGGLGSIGFLGHEYNNGTYLSTLPPDSYWVKIWAMYGNVGFTLWFCLVLYVLGRCCGVVWTTKDKALRIKLLALTAGFAGSFFCSYGNEVMNNQPSFSVMLLSWVLVFLGPKFDKEVAIPRQRIAKI